MWVNVLCGRTHTDIFTFPTLSAIAVTGCHAVELVVDAILGVAGVTSALVSFSPSPTLWFTVCPVDSDDRAGDRPGRHTGDCRHLW